MDKLLPDASSRSVVLGISTQGGLADAVASWCEALHDSGSLAQALGTLLRAVGAEAGLIARTNTVTGRCQTIAQTDRLARLAPRPLGGAYADGQFGDELLRSRVGAVWVMSSVSDPASPETDPRLGDFQASRGLGDFVVMVLATAAGARDHVELHFRCPLSRPAESDLQRLGQTLARTWATRRAGLVAGLLTERRALHDGVQTAPAAPILSAMNPRRLSRAEFRVCVLLSQGLSIAGVAAELMLSDATIRSHLRNIYAKTDATSLAHLVFQLMDRAAERDAALRRLA
jgi:DNA-binding CsgD family transcriptional regulator